jgi:hypothetical protein
LVSTGKTIRIFLADGEPIGILLAEISNWTGKLLVAPRSQLDQQEGGRPAHRHLPARRTRRTTRRGRWPTSVWASTSSGRLLRRSWGEAKDFRERTVVIVSKDENLTRSASATLPEADEMSDHHQGVAA